jgi:hypothetical protein
VSQKNSTDPLISERKLEAAASAKGKSIGEQSLNNASLVLGEIRTSKPIGALDVEPAYFITAPVRR